MALKDDVETLVRLLQWIIKALDAARKRIPPVNRIEDDPWDEIEAELDSAIAKILAITNEHSSRWRELVGHGMTGRQLAFKTGALKKLVSWNV